jgi:putative glutamine amidotransferase
VAQPCTTAITPTVLVTPDIESAGKEFSDLSISLSNMYQTALLQAGAVPLICPALTSQAALAECLRRTDGLLLTGGDDVEPDLYCRRLSKRIRATVGVTPDAGARSLRELLLIQQAFAQRKPLLAICRGHQLLNVALGGTLLADIPQQRPSNLDHRRLDQRCERVHEVRLTPGTLLAKITARQKLGVNSTHHQAVDRVAPPLRVSARGSDGIVEGLEFKPGMAKALPFLVSVQFHPERLAEGYAEHRAIFRAFVQACALSRQKNYEG